MPLIDTRSAHGGQPPLVVTGIDLANPLTRGLRHLFYSHWGWPYRRCLLTGADLTPGLGVFHDREGIYYDTSNFWTATLSKSFAPPVTILSGNLYTSGTVHWALGLSSAAWTGYYVQNSNYNVTSTNSADFSGSATPTEGSSRFPLGVKFLAMTMRGANDLRATLNGGPVASDTSCAAPSGTINTLRVGRSPNNDNGSFGKFLFWAVWDRAVTDAELIELSARPYQLFRQPRRAFYFASAGGGPITGDGSSAGVATASAVGASLRAAAGSSTGAATGTAVGASSVSAPGTASGVGTATAVGAAAISAVGAADGTSTASAVGTSATGSAGAASGAATAAAVGSSLTAAVGSSDGAAAGLAIGASIAAAAGSSDGVATAAAVGASVAAGSATGTAVGSSTAAAGGASLFIATALAQGVATAEAVGAFLASISATGSAAGTSTATAVSVPPVTEAEQGGGAGWPVYEEEDRPRVKSTRERVRDIIEELDEAAEEMREAVAGEPLAEVLKQPLDTAAIAGRMTRKPSRISLQEDDEDDDLLLLSH